MNLFEIEERTRSTDLAAVISIAEKLEYSIYCQQSALNMINEQLTELYRSLVTLKKAME